MASKKDRVHLNDSKATVRNKLELEDNEDFSKFEVRLLLYPLLFYKNRLRFLLEYMYKCLSIQAFLRPCPQLG